MGHRALFQFPVHTARITSPRALFYEADVGLKRSPIHPSTAEANPEHPKGPQEISRILQLHIRDLTKASDKSVYILCSSGPEY